MRGLRLLFGMLAILAAPPNWWHPAFAQTLPNRAVHIIVPFPPGGGADLAARTLAAKLTEGIGRPVVVDNRPGASGHLGGQAAAQSPADGTTLLLTSTGTITVSPHLQKLAYDPIADLAPVAMAGWAILAIAVNAATPIHSVSDLVKYANQAPGGIYYSVSVLATLPHLAAELFRITAKANWMPAAYKGTAPAANALMSGEVPASLSDLASLLPPSKGGRIRILAVTNTRRALAAPQVPTVAESGFPGYAADAWVAIFAPARTPAEIVARFNTELGRAVKYPEVRQTLINAGLEPEVMTPEELRKLVLEDSAKWGKLIETAKIKLE